jgi:protein SCO1/2
MSAERQDPRWPVWALAAIGAVTAAWWALALWPAGEDAPGWLRLTREVCFGASAAGLPDAGGWLLLVGQPLGMLIVLVAVWPAELRAGLSRLLSRVPGQLTAGAAAAAIVAGIAGVAVRVAGSEGEPFSAGPFRDLAAELTRIDDAPPAFELVDQQGQPTSLDAFRGRPVLVAFAYAHCATVCPAIVRDVIEAQRRLTDRPPAVLIVTLDPWRDTPARLPAIAAAWGLTDGARVLSGEPDRVERALNAWRIPRVRNERTGDLSHPSLVYVIDSRGRIAYALTGHADQIVAAVRAL